MRIVIVGVGIVGMNLTEQLVHEGHDVSVVDSSPERCEFVDERVDVLTVCGTGSSPSVLKEAGVAAADMVIAVTHSDEVNIVVCLVAQQLGVEHRIARLRSEEYSGKTGALDASILGITRVINPEQITVHTVLQFIETPGATDVGEFADGTVLLRGYTVTADMPIAQQTLQEISEQGGPNPALVVAIIRNGELIIPQSTGTILPDDNVLILFPRSAMLRCLALFNRGEQKVRKVVIYGATRTGIDLAKAISDKVKNVVLVEPDPAAARAAASELDSALVLEGDCVDPDVLAEAHVENADFFVAVTDDNEDNGMAALLAKKQGAKETLVVTTEPRHISLYTSIGVGHVINPRLSTASEILEVIRRGRIESVVKIHEGGAEAIQLVAMPDSAVTKRPLREVWRKARGTSIVGAVLRDNTVIIPKGDTIIQAGDSAVVFVRPEAIKTVEELFAKRRGLGI